MATHTYKVITTKGSPLSIEAESMVCGTEGLLFEAQEQTRVAFVPYHALISAQQVTATPAGDG